MLYQEFYKAWFKKPADSSFHYATLHSE